VSRSKGSRRDREAREVFEDAGFVTEKSVPAKYGRTDWFGGLFDFMAARPGTAFRLVQVKGGSASGIREMVEWAGSNLPTNVEAEYAVYYKQEGWRLVRTDVDGSYATLYDERKDDDVGPNVDTPLNLGEGLTRYLSAE